MFAERADYQYYLDNLEAVKSELGIRVISYCLMTNHVHLIVIPGVQTEHVSKLLRVVAARQTRYVNKLENRSGTLWEGRFKASLIDSDAYLLACCRYIDLNPVRAAMVERPEQYEWSSYRQRIGLANPTWIDAYDQYARLGQAGSERERAYRSFVAAGTPENQLKTIRGALQRNQLTGSERFRQQIEQRIGRRVSNHSRGRPRKIK